MPGSKFKPQFQRLLFIDRQIRAGHYPNCFELGRRWEVSYKTIQRDVDYLRDILDAPVEYDRVRRGFFYRDNTFFLPSVTMSEGDILALLIGTQALELYKGTPIAGELKSIYSRLAQLLPDKISLAPELIFNRFSFHGAPARPISADIWKALIRGVLNQRVTWIEYASPRSKQPKEHTIHPLHMANIEGDWYVLAFETRWEDIAQFAVSRIKKAEIKDATFVIPKGFAAERMMKDRFGKFIHTGGGKSVLVRLLFKADLAGQIAERAWHPKQKLKWRKDGSVELVFPVADVRDIIPWILSFGAGVRVLAPTVLLRQIRNVLRSAAGKYGR